MIEWTKDRHEAARARCGAATEGPWTRQPDRTDTATIVIDNSGHLLWDAVGLRNDADGDFISHAREDVPALLDEVERLQKKIAASRIPPPLTIKRMSEEAARYLYKLKPDQKVTIEQFLQGATVVARVIAIWAKEAGK